MRDGRHEVDLVADLGARGVIGIEIKAHSAPTPAHTRPHPPTPATWSGCATS